MAGMTGLQDTFGSRGMAGLEEATKRERERKNANNALENAGEAAKKGSMMTGLGIGTSVGVAAAGAAAGATAGSVLLAGAATGGVGLALGYLAYEYL